MSLKKNIFFTVDLEEWYHSKWFDTSYIFSKYFPDGPPDSDIRFTTERLLDLCEKYGVRITFFVLVSVVKRDPGLLEEITSRGHEVAIHGFEHLSILDLGPEEFKYQIHEAKIYVEKRIGERVYGYRAPHFQINSEGIETIESCGYKYDSSINPCLKIPGWYGNPKAPIHPYKISPSIIEFPASVYPIIRLPGAGGWYLRNLGTSWVKLLLSSLLARQDTAVFYIHPWELSDFNPEIGEIPFHVFRNTGENTFNAIASILKKFNHCDFSKTLRDYSEEI